VGPSPSEDSLFHACWEELSSLVDIFELVERDDDTQPGRKRDMEEARKAHYEL